VAIRHNNLTSIHHNLDTHRNPTRHSTSLANRVNIHRNNLAPNNQVNILRLNPDNIPLNILLTTNH
jgi:hypothetical protein